VGRFAVEGHERVDGVFLIGDNAASSYDSRGFGPVPADQIVGRVRFVLPAPGRLLAASAAAVLILGAVAVRVRRRRWLRAP
jgi:hypothetical protein